MYDIPPDYFDALSGLARGGLRSPTARGLTGLHAPSRLVRKLARVAKHVGELRPRLDGYCDRPLVVRDLSDEELCYSGRSEPRRDTLLDIRMCG